MGWNESIHNWEVSFMFSPYLFPFTYVPFHADRKSCLMCYRTQLSQKEQVLQQHASQLSNQMLHHSQIADRMRHYEEQGQLNELLQQDLEQARVI